MIYLVAPKYQILIDGDLRTSGGSVTTHTAETGLDFLEAHQKLLNPKVNKKIMGKK